MESVFAALKETPIPTILVITGIAFLLPLWQVNSSVTLRCLLSDNDGRGPQVVCYS